MLVEVDTTRTAILPLTNVSDYTASQLHKTADQYYWCEGETVPRCWDNPKVPDDLVTTKRAVRDDIYERLKTSTDLHANLVQNAIKQVVENVDALKTHWKRKRRISKPAPTTEGGWTMNFDKRCSTFSKTGLELSLVDGTRHRVDFVLPAELKGTPYSEYVLSELFEYRMPRIEYRPNSEHKFYAHIVTKAKFDAPPIQLTTQEQSRKSLPERSP